MAMATTTTRRALPGAAAAAAAGPAFRPAVQTSSNVPRKAKAAAPFFRTVTSTTTPRAAVPMQRLPLPPRPRIAAIGGWGRGGGVRWSSSDSAPPPPAGSKIWSFEEIQSLTSSSSPPSSNQNQPQQQQQQPPRTVTIIDVREPGEVRQTGRIPGAVNVPITSAPDSFHVGADEFEDRHGFPRPGRGDEVLFYCKAGVRSRAAAGLARDAGWERVGEYPGSWVDWVGRGGRVER